MKEYSERVPLLQKWADAGELASDSSVAFLLHAGDCYSDPNRITWSVKAIHGGADWVHQTSGLFYRISDGDTIMYNGRTKAYFTHLNMAFKTKYARTIPIENIPRGIDGYLFLYIKSAAESFTVVQVTGGLYSLDTHGHNAISLNRDRKFDDPKAPFERTDVKFDDLLIPEEVKERLIAMRDPMTKESMLRAAIKRLSSHHSKLSPTTHNDGYKSACADFIRVVDEVFGS